MTTTESTEPDPNSGVTSFSTTDLAADPVASDRHAASNANPGAEPVETHIGASGAAESGVADPETGETEIWSDRFAFGNFTARFLVGFFLIGLCGYFVLKASDPQHHGFRPLAIIAGSVTSLYWLWLIYRIFRSRLSHHYRLTSRRLFVCSGIFRRQEDMMELVHLKEVTIQQEAFFDRICNVGHVLVESEVKGAPTLILVGVNKPRWVMDLLYKYSHK